ncbi:MAG: RsmE family RNA methyltransferase [Eubacteriales bacterium]|nr:RsmE family RNA methyltransferase [Eubacteriales bacterium]MDD3349277.1 RsmE family RNA methyltransferase [Eubacteriales bacterium]
MSRFFVENAIIKEDLIEIIDPEDIKHISKVLRLRIGDQIDVSDTVAFEYETEIVSIEAGVIRVRILAKQSFTREPKLWVSLYQGVPKQGKMEEIIQKSVELGVHEIIPLMTERTVVDDKKNVDKKTERWQRVSAEAVKQCRRGIIPKIGNTKKLSEAVEDFSTYDLVLFPYEAEQNQTIKTVLKSLETKPKTIAFVIGPEGGFSKEEAKTIISRGGQSVSLGKTILRTETAGPASLAMIFYELELE